jgi:hypothetical protein
MADDQTAAWQKSLHAKSIQQIETDLAHTRYGPASEWKAKMAVNTIQAKKDAIKEQGEAAKLRDEILGLKTELRDKSKSLFWTRIGVVVAILAALAAWASIVWTFVRSAVSPVTGV